MDDIRFCIGLGSESIPITLIIIIVINMPNIGKFISLIGGLVQDCCNSIVNAVELLKSFAKP